MIAKTKEVKILYNLLCKRMWKNDKSDPTIEEPLYEVIDVLKYIYSLKPINRFYDLKDNKFCFLSDLQIENKGPNLILYGFFKSARNEYRPNLIDKKTGNERRNPKSMTEGDIEKTHFSMKINYNASDVYLFLEKNASGINMNNVINYISLYTKIHLEKQGSKKNFKVFHNIILRDDFFKEIDAMNRTRLTEVYFDKKLLGSNALNFSNRISSIKKEIKLSVSAEFSESIKEFTIDVFNKLNSSKSGITKIRVMGKDKDDSNVIIDTSYFSKVDSIEVDINDETGELNTTQIISFLKKTANNI